MLILTHDGPAVKFQSARRGETPSLADRIRRSKLADRLAWLADAPDNAAEDYRPGWQGNLFRPDPAEEAEALGYEIGLEGESIRLPPHWTPGQVLGFLRGRRAGLRERDRRLEAMFESAPRAGDPITDRDVYPHGVC